MEDVKVSVKEGAIIKENYILWGIKHYVDHKDFYLCGIKICSTKELFNNKKVFLVFNTACFGDVLLCNSLCQNIKTIFPDSKVVFITDKNWAIAAQYQQGVDEVFVYDKKGIHKGFGGMFKFVKEFPYKNPFASFITYKNERNFLIAKLLKSRFVFLQISSDKKISTQLKHTMLLKDLTDRKIENLPIRYNLPAGIKNSLNGKKYIAMCCITKNPPKDMPLKTALELINKINSNTDYKVVLTGAGELSQKYAEDLKNAGADFINLVNKTSILELGAVLKDSAGLISCDTGTMHYGCALEVPTVAVFYDQSAISQWAPSSCLYNSKLISKKQNSENILNGMTEVILKS